MKTVPQRLEHYTSTRRGIYLIPNKKGMIFLSLIFTIFYMAMSYANNVMLSFAFFLFSFFIVLLVIAHFNMYGHQWLQLQLEDGFAYEPLHLKLSVDPKGIFYPRDIQVKLKTKQGLIEFEPTSLESGSTELHCQTKIEQRGRREIQKVTLVSSYPLGLFHVWHHIPVQQTFYIYPARNRKTKLPSQNEHEMPRFSQQWREQGEFYQHHAFQGENYRKIDWKAFARRDELWVKEQREFLSPEVTLNWYQMDAEDTEGKLQQLSSLIEYCWKHRRSWNLILPQKQYSFDYSKKHYQQCLRGISDFSA